MNLNPNEGRKLIIQAGAFGEHRFGTAKYFARTSEWPGELGGYAGSYAAPPLRTEARMAAVNNTHLCVELPPGMEITLDVTTERFVNEPSYSRPW